MRPARFALIPLHVTVFLITWAFMGGGGEPTTGRDPLRRQVAASARVGPETRRARRQRHMSYCLGASVKDQFYYLSRDGGRRRSEAAENGRKK